MIKVRAIGKIEADLGKSLIQINRENINLRELMLDIFGINSTSDITHVKSNILIIVNGTAITDYSDNLLLDNGDEVVLIPITHGG